MVDLARQQADSGGAIIDQGAFPVVLGGDDRVLLGCLLALPAAEPRARNLGELRAVGMKDAAKHAIAFLSAQSPDRIWLHLDADCLSDEVMPAVDWRVDDGLKPDELVALARPLCTRRRCSATRAKGRRDGDRRSPPRSRDDRPRGSRGDGPTWPTSTGRDAAREAAPGRRG